MKQLLLWLTALLILVACNHEAPTNIGGYDNFSEIKFRVTDNWDNPGNKYYQIFLPAPWCTGGTPDDKINPWIRYCRAGNAYQPWMPSIQDAEAGYENYYSFTIEAAYYEELIIFVVYGNYFDADTYIKANIKESSAYDILYDVTTNKTQVERVLAFRLNQGWISPINPNLVQPLRAEIVAPGNLVLGQPNQFRLDNLEYTNPVGIKDIVWLFPDGYTRNGQSVTHTLRTHGTVRVTITDNLNKSIMIFKDL